MAFKLTKRQLGIYFATDRLYVAETDGIHLVNKAESSLSGVELKEPILSGEGSKETNIAILLKESLRKSNIETKEALVGLSTRDLIIRGFEIPNVPSREIPSAIIFEAKKYIPFKTEELIFDSQHTLDKKLKKLEVVFVATKKDLLNSYLEILKQAGIRVVSIEPASFSLVRLLKFSKNSTIFKSTLAIANFDKEGGDITILDRGGFPCFSCEIKFLSSTNEELEIDTIFSRLSNELRISLDYYYRQFSRPKIERIILLPGKNTPDWAEEINKELDIPCISVNLEELDPLKDITDFKLARAFSISLRNVVKSSFNINLLTKPEIFTPEFSTKINISDIFKRFSLISPREVLRPAIPMLILLFFIFVFNLPKISSLSGQLNTLRREQKVRSPDLISAPLDDLRNTKQNNINRLSAIENAVIRKNHLTYTYIWNILPQLTPRGLWLETMEINQEPVLRINLTGLVYLNDDSQERTMINKFVNSLKQDDKFSKFFKEIRLGYINKLRIKDYNVTKFEVSCQ